MSRIGKFLLLIFFYNYFEQNAASVPQVSTKLGLIQGLKATDGNYDMYLGIPYANVDKNQPFGPSTPQLPFVGIYTANDDSAVCPQLDEFNNTIVGNLDCLRLNVFVPHAAKSGQLLPVMVWIHGGAFEIGYGNRQIFGPSFLMKRDVILVTINYRLGPYGFMCLNMPEVTGNQGLKDQRRALRWVKNNIKEFGGDSDKITLAGESAGSASVEFHYLYDEENLFSQAIMQSGSALAPWAMREVNDNIPIILASTLRLETNSTKHAIAYLSLKDTSDVIAAGIENHLMYRPCVEQFETNDNFIRVHPVKKPITNKYPVLTGYNSNEMVINHPNRVVDSDYVARLLKSGFVDISPEYEELVDSINEWYQLYDVNNFQKVIDFDSDFWINHSVERLINKTINENVVLFAYFFSYEGGRSYLKIKNNINASGAIHTDEIGYLFDGEYLKRINRTYNDQIMIDTITTLWSNFMKYGEPTPQKTALLPIIWQPLTLEKRNYINLGGDKTYLLTNLNERPLKDRMDIWDFIYSKYQQIQRGL